MHLTSQEKATIRLSLQTAIQSEREMLLTYACVSKEDEGRIGAERNAKDFIRRATAILKRLRIS